VPIPPHPSTRTPGRLFTRFPLLRGLPGTPLLIVLPAASLAVVTLLAWLYAAQLADQIRLSHAPHLVAIGSIRYEVAEAHLLLEEILGGDTTEDADQVRSRIGHARTTLSALAGGDVTLEEYGGLPLDAGSDLINTKPLRRELDNFSVIAEQRLANPATSGAGTPLDASTDAIYHNLMGELDLAQRRITATMDQRMVVFHRIQWLLAGIALTAAGLVLWLARRTEQLEAGHRHALQQEITSREADQEQMALLATTVEQAYEIIMITDHDARIRYINGAFSRLLGYRLEDVGGKYAEMLRSPRHTTEFYETLYRQLVTGTPWRGTLFYKGKWGEELESEAAITPIRGTDGTVTHMVSVARDVSREKSLQAQMEHMQRLESLGILAGGIAHDFNNILTSIMGSAGLARQSAENGNPVVGEYLDRIETSAERAGDLCRQMLAYSGRSNPVIGRVSLSDAVQEMGRLLEATIPKHVCLEYELAPDLPEVDADRAQISQVIMNLVINAHEAIGGASSSRESGGGTGGEGSAVQPAGTIRITTGHVRLDSRTRASAVVGGDRDEGDYVFLDVTDTGCGMDADTRQRVFDPFFTTKFTGRGLGMSAVLGIVRGHHGAILLTTEPGRGTSFRVLFPAAGPPRVTSAVADHVATWRGNGTVLVVDDEEAVRHVTRAMLDRMGFHTVCAENGVRGIEQLDNGARNAVCVLLDMTMPLMNGAETLRHIRSRRPQLPVLLISGYTAEDAAAHLGGDRFTAFLQKPFRAADLELALRRVTGS